MTKTLRQISEAFAATFGTQSGMETLKHLRQMYDRQSYVKGDEFETVYREGQRSVLIYIRGLMKQAGIKEGEEEE